MCCTAGVSGPASVVGAAGDALGSGTWVSGAALAAAPGSSRGSGRAAGAAPGPACAEAGWAGASGAAAAAAAAVAAAGAASSRGSSSLARAARCRATWRGARAGWAGSVAGAAGLLALAGPGGGGACLSAAGLTLTLTFRAGLASVAPPQAGRCEAAPGSSAASNWRPFGSASLPRLIFSRLGGGARWSISADQQRSAIGEVWGLRVQRIDMCAWPSDFAARAPASTRAAHVRHISSAADPQGNGGSASAPCGPEEATRRCAAPVCRAGRGWPPTLRPTSWMSIEHPLPGAGGSAAWALWAIAARHGAAVGSGGARDTSGCDANITPAARWRGAATIWWVRHLAERVRRGATRCPSKRGQDRALLIQRRLVSNDGRCGCPPARLS